ncbi:hypothetical protein Gotur_027237, partial [Gossypium turneri]
MEEDTEDLQIEDNEKEAWSIHEDGDHVSQKYEFCLVGYFLTASVINFQAMRNTMANIWHFLGGVMISNLGEKWFLFKFYHELDIGRVENGAHWTFNTHIIVFHYLKKNEELLRPPVGQIYCKPDWKVTIKHAILNGNDMRIGVLGLSELCILHWAYYVKMCKPPFERKILLEGLRQSVANIVGQLFSSVSCMTRGGD